MKRILSILYICFLAIVLIGCDDAISGEQGLIEIARKEITISNAGNTDLDIGGHCVVGEYYLYWFISGNDNQAHICTPIEFFKTDTDSYRFVRKYKPMERAQDIAVLAWNGGYSFIINNTACSFIRLEDHSGNIEDIPVDSVPFVYFLGKKPAKYSFLDIDGMPLL